MGAGAEEAGEAEGGVGGDAALAAEDLAQAVRRDTHQEGGAVRGDVARPQLGGDGSAGVDGQERDTVLEGENGVVVFHGLSADHGCGPRGRCRSRSGRGCAKGR